MGEVPQGLLWGGGAIVVIVAFLAFIASLYQKAAPNEALVVYGMRGFRCVYGGGTVVYPVIEQVSRLSLEVMTLDIQTPEVYTQQGVPIMVEGVAQVKVDGSEEMIRTAAEQFLTKTPAQIMNVALQTVEGHLRAILGTMTVEEAYSNRDAFAQRCQEVAASDLANMGLRVVSFTIKDIRDKQGYLDALGKTRIAQVKRDAQIGEAEAQRDATIKSAQAKQQGEEARFVAEAKIAEAQRDYSVKSAEYKRSVQEVQANADLAYDLQKYRTSQDVKREEVRIQAIEKEGLIEVETREIERRTKELQAQVERPADAERYRIETLAEAAKMRATVEAQGQAEAARSVGAGEADAQKSKGLAFAETEKARGLAEAAVQEAKGLADGEAIRAKGLADAEAMMKKAAAWQQYNQAAVIERVIEVLPEVAQAIAAPLSKTEKIVLVSAGGDGPGASKITGDIAKVIAQLPPVIQALAGIDITKMLSALPGIGQASPESPETPAAAEDPKQAPLPPGP